MITTVLAFILTLGVLIVIHEYGHYRVAVACGVKVLRFSVGFGRVLLRRQATPESTEFVLCALPLGGYVKMLDEREGPVASAELDRSFNRKRLWQRAAIVAAGPIANFILAIIIFATIFAFYGRQTTTARVDTVVPNSAAAAAGLKPGDVVLAIDGRTIESFSDMQRVVSANAGRTLTFQIDRGGAPMTLTATPALKQGKDGFGNSTCQAVLGVSRSMAPGDVKTEYVNPLAAVWLGTKETWFIIDRTFSYIGGLFTGRECADQLGGPIRIAQISGQVATLGFLPVLHLAAMLSVSIGLLNLFPVPLLDGGHLMFYLVEATRGRPLSAKAQEIGFRIGFAIVVMLMIFTVFNDTIQLLPRLWAS